MQLTGRVFIALNGNRIRSMAGARLSVGGKRRDPVVSDAGVDGFTESIVEPRVECRIQHGPGISLKELQDFQGTLVFEADSGAVFTLSEAWCAEPPTLAKGEVDLNFAARECIEG